VRARISNTHASPSLFCDRGLRKQNRKKIAASPDLFCDRGYKKRKEKEKRKKRKNFLLLCLLPPLYFCALVVNHCSLMMSSLLDIVSVSCCPVIFDGVNYNHWTQHMRLHMRGQCLWDVISGELLFPACPEVPSACSFGLAYW
jgi:hypothetical protein